jgi:diguanylate cyclase (GGDEF)-like protein
VTMSDHRDSSAVQRDGSSGAATRGDVGRHAPDAGIAPLPADEAARLRTLDRYRILDTGRDARFEELAAEVAEACGTPIATITFVDATRQWFKASVGIPFEQTARDIAFCSHTILDADHPLIIEDASRDPRFADNPLVLGDPHLLAYAGAPMVAPDGTVIGTVCAMDYRPRAYTPQQVAVLQRVAAQVIELLDATSAAELLLGGDATADRVPGAHDTGPADDALALTRPLIEAIGEDVDIVAVLEDFCRQMLDTFGWWAARVAWVQGDSLHPGGWLLASGAPPVLARLAESASRPLALADLSLTYRDPAMHDIGMLNWIDDRDLVAAVGGRYVVVIDVPGATSLAARLVFLLPSTRAFTVSAARALTTAAAVLPRVFVQDRARRELTYRATHDVLTGLLNREGLSRRYDRAEDGRGLNRAVLFIDLDDFKRVNDRLGHRAGDEVLIHVARQLSGRIRPTDTAARLGGDEFLVVLDGILHEEEALQVARRLLSALCGSYSVFHTERVELSVSIGVTMWQAGLGLGDAADAADTLMYAAKELGGAAIAADGPGGRRLLGASDTDERDLDDVLSGALQVAMARMHDQDGHLRGVRAELASEVRHPSVADMGDLVLRSLGTVLSDVATAEGPPELVLAPAAALWLSDGLVLRLCVFLAASLPGVRLLLVLTSAEGDEHSIGQALVIRDALGLGLVVGGFGALGGGLGLVDRVAPAGLELAPEVLEPRDVQGPSSAQVAALALAERTGLMLVLLTSDGRADGLSDDGARHLRLVDLSSSVVHRREPPGPAAAPHPAPDPSALGSVDLPEDS